jgi:glycosyltransferase involved in cell wall biosynthesis
MLSKPPGSPFDYYKAVHALVTHVRAKRPDAMILYQHYGNVAGALAAKIAGCPRVIANQNGLPSKLAIPRAVMLLDKFFGSCGFYDYNVTNSHSTASAFSRYPRSYRRRLVRIVHGVPQIGSELDRLSARARFGLPLDVFLVAAVGRLAQEKNHEAAVLALQYVPDMHLAIAGQGPLRGYLGSLAKKLGVEGRLHLVGELDTDNVGHFYSAADVFTFPSVWETFGLAAVEAAIAGVPVVCSDLPVLREVLTTPAGGEAALFFDHADPSAIANAIVRLRDASSLRDRLRQRGTELLGKYAVSAMVGGYESCLVQKPLHEMRLQRDC